MYSQVSDHQASIAQPLFPNTESASAVIRVLLVEDHLLVRHATKLLIHQDASVRVVGEADDMPEALDMVATLHPDVALIDIRLRSSTGLELAKAIKRGHPSVKIIALTGFGYEQYFRAMKKAGAEGFLLKSVSGAELLRAIHDAHEGREVHSSESNSRLMASASPSGAAITSSALKRDLTPREMEILEMLQGSMSSQEIAERLRVSPKTVYTHMQHILSKLGQPTRSDAVSRAVNIGLLTMVD